MSLVLVKSLLAHNNLLKRYYWAKTFQDLSHKSLSLLITFDNFILILFRFMPPFIRVFLIHASDSSVGNKKNKV